MSFFKRILPILFVLLAYKGFTQSCISTGLNGTIVNLPCNVNCTPFQFKVPHLKSTSDYSIMGPYHDINPNVTSTSPNRKIEWRVDGSAPCRELIVSFFEIALFGDNSQKNTAQMVMHESTGLIDVYIKDKTLDQDGSPWD